MALAALLVTACARGHPPASGSFSPDPPPPPAASPMAQDVPPPMIRRAQRLLTELGYPAGPADGIAGVRTRAAVTEFQKAAGLRPDGRVSYKVLLELDRARDGSAVAEAQDRLARLGYNPGPVDGVLGQRTVQAIGRFERAQGLDANGRVTPELLDRLAQAEASGARGDRAAAVAAESPSPAELVPQPAAGARAEPEDAKETAESEKAGETPVPPAAAAIAEPDVTANEFGEPLPPLDAPGREQMAARETGPAPDEAWSKRRIAPDDLVRLHERGVAGELRELVVDADARLQLTEDVSIDTAGLTSYELQEQVITKLVEIYLLGLEVEVVPASAAVADGAVAEQIGNQPAAPETAPVQEATAAYDGEPAPDQAWSSRRIAPGDLVRLRLGGESGELRELVVDADGRLQLTESLSAEVVGLTSYQLQEQVMVKLVENYMRNLGVEILPAAGAEPGRAGD